MKRTVLILKTRQNRRCTAFSGHVCFRFVSLGLNSYRRLYVWNS